jgi:hypothetical protein
MADHTVTWWLTWQDELAAELADRMLTCQGDCTMVDVAQWLATTWPSHGMPHGSGKMPNDNSRMNFQKKYM